MKVRLFILKVRLKQLTVGDLRASQTRKAQNCGVDQQVQQDEEDRDEHEEEVGAEQ